jgi:hypothetical protein
MAGEAAETPASDDDHRILPEVATVLDAFEEAVEEFEAKPTVAFSSEGERQQQYFKHRREWAEQWSRPGPCMYRGCTEESIKRSHTIPLSASLKLIAEYDHVLTPTYKDFEVDLSRISAKQASTFPGFCEEHERLFSDFESKKEMSSIEHFRLQAFRTVCREIYRKRHDLGMISASLEAYRKRRDDYVLNVSRAAALDASVKVRKIEFEGDRMESMVLEKLDDFRADLADLYRFYDDLLEDIRAGSSKIPLKVVDFPWQVPLGLSGIGILRYDPKRYHKLTLCFLAVIPESKGTKVILGGPPEHWNALQPFLLKNEGPFHTLSLIERFMCRGSDHWFMKPSLWSKIPENRKNAIRKALLQFSKSLRYRVPFSVFDDVRLALISNAEAQLPKLTPSERRSTEKLIQRQKAKLNYVSDGPEERPKRT